MAYVVMAVPEIRAPRQVGRHGNSTYQGGYFRRGTELVVKVVMAYIVIAYEVMVYGVVAYIVMAFVVMAYIVMAYIYSYIYL